MVSAGTQASGPSPATTPNAVAEHRTVAVSRSARTRCTSTASGTRTTAETVSAYQTAMSGVSPAANLVRTSAVGWRRMSGVLEELLKEGEASCDMVRRARTGRTPPRLRAGPGRGSIAGGRARHRAQCQRAVVGRASACYSAHVSAPKWIDGSNMWASACSYQEPAPTRRACEARLIPRDVIRVLQVRETDNQDQEQSQPE